MTGRWSEDERERYVWRLAYTQDRELSERVEGLYFGITASAHGGPNGPLTARLVKEWEARP